MTTRSPEYRPDNMARLNTVVRKAIKDAGIDICPALLVAEVVGLLVNERVAMRALIAERIVGPTIGRYTCGNVGGITDHQLEMLATTIQYYFEDGEGRIHVEPGVLKP